DRVYLQGCRDAVSFMVRDAVVTTLESLGWERGKGLAWLGIISDEKLRQVLTLKIGPGKIGRGSDVILTVGLLSWLRQIPDYDFKAFLLDAANASQFKDVYWNLREIPYVGPKIASFVLRDLILGLRLSQHITDPIIYEYLCPVDVHVRRTADSIGINDPDDSSIISGIVTQSLDSGCDPLLVDQGMFAVGKSDRLNALLDKHGLSFTSDSSIKGNADVLPVKVSVARTSGGTSRGKSKQPRKHGFRASFWDAFNRYLDLHGKDFPRRQPGESHWYHLRSGSSGKLDYGLTIRLKESDVTCELNLIYPKSKDNFLLLYSHRQAIEDQLGFGLEWQEYPERKESRIRAVCALDPEVDGNWTAIFEWFIRTSEAVMRVFDPYMNILV
ncbi:DUF4268 domain-containing protein, partial [Candidatus Bathyarchaeota archaeon]|nr:DUF4268 domain-containing protein [Candidatus Bathyarchaeota archaeon]